VKVFSAAAGLAMTGLMMAGCSSSASPGSTTSTSSTAVAPASTSTTTSTSSSRAANLPVTDQIRSQLVAAGADLNSIPVAEYTGLAPGLTYYALDKESGTYWAGARLVPAPSSDLSSPTRAQVASQDAGSYYLFSQPKGGSWTAYAAGNVGPGAPCPVTVPAEVIVVWGWPAGSCRPAGV
jgi:hypothetical protein